MTRLPDLLLGLAGLLTLAILGEVFWIYLMFGGFDPVYLIFLGSSLPFLGVLALGGWRLRHGWLPRDRHRRIGGWTMGGIVFWGALFLIVGVLSMPIEEIWGAVRWGVTVGGGLGFLVGVFEARAIEHERRAERRRTRSRELQRRTERLEEFSRIVSHDLRNPLSVAFAHLELAGAEMDSEHLDAVERALTRMDVILSDTLELARQGQVITDREPVEVASLARQAWNNVPTEHATLEVTVKQSVEGDAERLVSVLENLFRNALEHGGSDVALTVGALPDAPGFFIEDDGPGIPEEEREAVFEPGESSKADGTGFGLTIVRSIIAAHNWDISVVEGRSGGARFEVRTDRENADMPAREAVQPAPKPS